MIFGRRSRRTNWPLGGFLLGLVLAAAAYVVLAAWLQSRGGGYHFDDLLLPRMVDVMVVIWLFWIGSAVGSFLNVVAWRVPRGRSISGWSHCPWCNTRLGARDNWPVFGWLALRGRCRTCRLPISPRYPIVEFSVGLTFTVLGLAELYSGGSNLPFLNWRTPNPGPLSAPLMTAELFAIAIYHAVALSGGWALGLVRFDGHRLPRGLVLCIFLLVMGPLWVWPPLMVVPWHATVPADWQPTRHLDAVMRLLTAAVAAAVVARMMARYVCPTADPKLDPTGSGTGRLLDLTALLCVPGVVVGWQALLGVVLLAVALGGFLMRWFGSVRHSALGSDGLAWLAVSLPPAMVVQIAFWQPLEEWLLWPAAGSPPWVILAASAMVLIVPIWLRLKPERRDTDHLYATQSEEPD